METKQKILYAITDISVIRYLTQVAPYLYGTLLCRAISFKNLSLETIVLHPIEWHQIAS